MRNVVFLALFGVVGAAVMTSTVEVIGFLYMVWEGRKRGSDRIIPIEDDEVFM